jgi:HAD superfamily hydrolase (TIGR01490 family)
MKGIAFFDMDGTITTKDTFLDFIVYCRGQFVFRFGLILLSGFILLYYCKLFSNKKLKEIFFTFFLSSFSQEELETLGISYARDRLPLLIRGKATQQIEWHRNKQHRIVIITASSSIWLGAWCKEQGIELIGTEFNKTNNRYTGKIKGENCFGEEKLRRVKALLHNMLPEHLETYGYGDTHSDKYFLNALNHSVFKPFRD